MSTRPLIFDTFHRCLPLPSSRFKSPTLPVEAFALRHIKPCGVPPETLMWYHSPLGDGSRTHFWRPVLSAADHRSTFPAPLQLKNILPAPTPRTTLMVCGASVT